MKDNPGFSTAPPTHHCAMCGVPLWANWPYAACKACGKKPCRHGNTLGECSQCDIEADFAYDASKGN